MNLLRFFKGIRRFLGDKEGASGIEYAIIAAMVAVVIAGLSPGVGTAITTSFGKINTALGTPVGG